MLSEILQWYFKKLAILLQFNTWNIIFLPLEITEQQDLSFHSMFYLGDKILIFDCCLQDKTLSERRRECKRFWEIWQTCFTNFIPAQIRYLIHARISKSGLGWHHLEIKKLTKNCNIYFFSSALLGWHNMAHQEYRKFFFPADGYLITPQCVLTKHRSVVN